VQKIYAIKHEYLPSANPWGERERERKREKEKDTFISTAATLTPWATAADLGATEQK
jgi:hypothetical protein